MRYQEYNRVCSTIVGRKEETKKGRQKKTIERRREIKTKLQKATGTKLAAAE